MEQITKSSDKLEKGFAIGAIVAAILVGAVLYVLYPNSFNMNQYGGASQSQAGSTSQYGSSPSQPASPSATTGSGGSSPSTGNSGY